MKILIIFLLVTLNAYARECVVDTTHKTEKDCVACGASISSPGEKSSNLMSGLLDFATDKKDQIALIDKFKAYSQFLVFPKNQTECSNYKVLLSSFQNDFQKELSECEKGPSTLDRRKLICDYVLNQYSRKINDSFYAHWSTMGPNGKPILIAGRTKEQIEGPIRAHESWCRKVKKAYNNKMYIDCGDVTEWVREFDIIKNVSESMRRDREKGEEEKAVVNDRTKFFNEACKYFDKNPATRFTAELYLQCITR